MASIDPKFAKRISEKTGLKTEEEILAYTFFVEHSGLKDGVIMYGDVQHEFYEDLLEKASEPMQVLERAYNQSIGNHEGVPLNESPELKSRLVSPLSAHAKQVFAKYYHQFVEKEFIVLPESFSEGRYDSSQYPRLIGYNYFNDSEVYIKYKNKGEKAFSGRMTLEYFEKVGESEKKRGVVFSH